MAKRSLFAGSTSIATLVRIFDVNGSPITGLVYNSTGLLAKYDVPGSATATITLATQTVSGAFSSGGFVEIDATAFPGLYRLDVPNAALANGPEVVISIYGYTGMSACMVEFDLWAVNPQDATAFGVSRIDALISSRMATFSLPTNFSSLSIDASGRVDLVKVLGATVNALISGRVDASVGAYQTGLTPLQPATAGRTLVVDAAGLADANAVKVGPTGSGTAQTARDIGATLGVAGAGLTALGDARIAHLDADVSSRTKPADTQARVTLVDTVTTYTGNTPQTGDNFARIGAPVGASISADIAAIKADTASIITTLASLAAAVATAVWAAGTRSLTTFGTLVADTAAAVWASVTRSLTDKAGFTLTSAYDPAKTAAQAGDAMALTSGERTTLGVAIWASATRTLTSFGTLVSDIWGAVADSSGVTTLLARLSAGRATNLDNLDVAVSTRFPTSSYTAPDNSGIAVAAAASASAATSAASANLKLGTPAGASVSADIAVIAGRVFRVKKNTALAGFQFPMTSAAGLGLTGLTVTAQRSLDGGALASCANAVSEISDGVYKIDLAATDLNADTVFLRFSATGAIDTTVTLVTQP